MLLDVSIKRLYFTALHVDQLSAGFTLKVIALLLTYMIVFRDELVACTGAFIYDIFVEASFRDALLELSVNGSRTDRAALVFHAGTDLARCHVLSRDRLKICE